MTGFIHWNDLPVAFVRGESVANALSRAGILHLGQGASGQSFAVFCGIGQCQGCLVLHDGALSESCLLPCADGMRLYAAVQEAGHE